MTRTEHLLTILIEECNETAQRATKALRFGMDEIQPEQPLTNAERIVYEFNDIWAIMGMLHNDSKIKKVFDIASANQKQQKVEKYLTYSAQCGTLNT